MEDGLEVMEDFVVGEADNDQSGGLEDSLAFAIGGLLLIVHAPVDLDDQTQGMTIEIRDEPLDDLLATKARALESSPTNRPPQPCFRARGKPPHLARPHELPAVDMLSGQDTLLPHDPKRRNP